MMPLNLTRGVTRRGDLKLISLCSSHRAREGKEPGRLRDLAGQLRSKLAAPSAAAVSDKDWEWYITLSLPAPSAAIRLLEDSSQQPVRLRQISLFLSLLSTP
jgi:hypothetical protein